MMLARKDSFPTSKHPHNQDGMSLQQQRKDTGPQLWLMCLCVHLYTGLVQTCQSMEFELDKVELSGFGMRVPLLGTKSDLS